MSALGTRSSIAWGDRAAMRAWAAQTGLPAVALVAAALERIAVDPVGAVAEARAWMTPVGPGTVAVPLVGAHREAFQRSAAALDAAFGGALPVAPVVRALVRAALDGAPVDGCALRSSGALR
jgi:hypothetical protein